MPLTDGKIRNAKAEAKQYKLFDERGLFLIVTPKGGKWWRLKYRFSGKEQSLALGTYPDTGLKRARDKRDEARKLLADGIDPAAQRKAEKDAEQAEESFEQVAREWIRQQHTRLASDTLQLATRRLERWVFPHLGEAHVGDLEPPQVLQVLRRIEAAGKHETAHRVRQRISQVCRYAIATGRATRDPTKDLQGALAPAPIKNRAAITEPRQVGALLRGLWGYTGQPTTCAALKLMALTFVRPGELRKAEWSEFDLNKNVWRLPAVRMKMKREHVVPLAPLTVEILRDLQSITGHRPYVFESTRRGRPMSENTLNIALQTIGYTGDQMTAHGFRAMASTLLHELGWPPEVIELQLAHAQRSQVAAAYNRSARLPERRRMMDSWAGYLSALREDKNHVTHDLTGDKLSSM